MFLRLCHPHITSLQAEVGGEPQNLAISHPMACPVSGKSSIPSSLTQQWSPFFSMKPCPGSGAVLSRDVMGKVSFLAASEGAATCGSHREKLFKTFFCVLGFGWTHARSTKHRFLAILLSGVGEGLPWARPALCIDHFQALVFFSAICLLDAIELGKFRKPREVCWLAASPDRKLLS